MKRLLMSCMALTILFSACSKDEDNVTPTEQTYVRPFSVSSLESDYTGRVTSYELESKVTFTNLTNKSMDIVWERYSEDFPEGWETAVCDNEACHVPTVTTRTMTVAANEVFEMKSVIRPNEIAGTGSCKIRLYDATNREASEQVITYITTAQ